MLKLSIEDLNVATFEPSGTPETAAVALSLVRPCVTNTAMDCTYGCSIADTCPQRCINPLP
jgi:hypothetical protein